MDEFDKMYLPARIATNDSGPATDDESNDREWSAVRTPDTPRTTATTSSFSELNLTPTRTVSHSRVPSSASQSQRQHSSQLHATYTLPTPTTFPTLTSLPRPDLLFSSTPPYLIHIRFLPSSYSTPNSYQQGPLSKIHVSATHPPSLQLLHDYFRRWTRRDPNASTDVSRGEIPMVNYTLFSSVLGPGAVIDTLVIEPWSQIGARRGDGYVASVVQVLAFVEGVLGYKRVGGDQRGTCSGDGVFWELRRDIGFA